MAVIAWLPQVAVMPFSMRPAGEILAGHDMGLPGSFRLFTDCGKVFLESEMPRDSLNSR